MRQQQTDYANKLDRVEPQTLLPVLAPATRAYVRKIASQHRFTVQELRQVAIAARDLEMWGERPLESRWPALEAEVSLGGRERKRALLRLLEQQLAHLRTNKSYPEEATPGRRRPMRLVEAPSPRQIFGRCPAYSERTVCCRLHTIDAVTGCPFGCSYCTVQTFYPEQAELRVDLAARLDELELDPERFYHVGTGQASDSLVWGNRGGILDALLAFAERHPNVLLELKTKSDTVTPLLERIRARSSRAKGGAPRNVVCSWSLASETVIAHEEQGTASLARRLRAARRAVAAGLRVAFHFHPLIAYDDAERDHRALVRRLLATFDPTAVAFVSMGSLTLIRPVVREIRRRGGPTRILQMPQARDPHGKLTYPDEVKLGLYRPLARELEPWRQRGVFVYLCMETDAIWRAVLGHSYATNEAFEREFGRTVLPRSTAQ